MQQSKSVIFVPRSDWVGLSICWFGTVENVKRKRIDSALLFLKGLVEQGVNAHLLLVGSGEPDQTYIKLKIVELNLFKRITFLETVSEDYKFTLLSSVDAYLQLSKYEGFGVAAGEALLMALPVIHSNVGGLQDFAGRKGIIVNKDRIDQMNQGYINIAYKNCRGFGKKVLNNLKLAAKYSVSEKAKRLISFLS